MLSRRLRGGVQVVTYPGYQSLFEVARSIGCTVDLWEPEATSTGLQFNPHTLHQLVTPNTKLVAVNFPHNPTGCVPSHEQWAAVVSSVSAVSAHLFCDEMYRGLELHAGATLASGTSPPCPPCQRWGEATRHHPLRREESKQTTR